MGLIHLDAGVVIGLLDGADRHHLAATRVLRAATTEGHGLALSASAVAECLVGPYRRGDEAVETVRDLLGRLPISVVAIDVEVAATAAELRARHRRLRLPDALVIAAAIVDGADSLVTTDQGWPSASELDTSLEIAVL